MTGVQTCAFRSAASGLPELDASTPALASAQEFHGFHTVPVWDERMYAMVAAIPKSSGKSAWENNSCRHCGPVDVTSDTVECPLCLEPMLRPIVKEPDGRYRLIKGFASSYRRMHPDRPASTVTTASGHVGSDFTIHPTQNRLLSILECATLQTFPEDFYWGEALEKYGSTNVREMIGEAVPPAFTKLHGEVLVGLLNGEWTRAPITLSDERCTKAWAKLATAAQKDGRLDPRRYFEYAMPPSKTRATEKQKMEHCDIRTLRPSLG